MVADDLRVQVNVLVEKYLAEGGTLDDLRRMLGVNLSTLWRSRKYGFKDPYAVYLIAKAAGEPEEDALTLAKEACIANGGNPDYPRTRGRPGDKLREHIRELIREEMAKLNTGAKESA